MHPGHVLKVRLPSGPIARREQASSVVIGYLSWDLERFFSMFARFFVFLSLLGQ